MGAPTWKAPFKLPELLVVKALAIVIWRQGIKRDTRWKFWHHLFSRIRRNPGVAEHYLATCAHIEHFMEYRQIARDQIESQLEEFIELEAQEQQKPVTQNKVAAMPH